MGSKLFNGIPADAFIEGDGPAGEFITVTGDAGTHIDDPGIIFLPVMANHPGQLKNFLLNGSLQMASYLTTQINQMATALPWTILNKNWLQSIIT